MKKLTRLFGMGSILWVLILVIARWSPSVYAASTIATKTPVPTPTPTRVEYMLPYPGMLPDSPLYVLKNLRDTIIEVLISSPVSKAEFYILQADKKLNMGVIISGKGKSDEAKEILGQSFAARSKAIDVLSKEMSGKKNVPPYVLEKLVLSLKKHKEVLTDLHMQTDALSDLLMKAERLTTPTP